MIAWADNSSHTWDTSSHDGNYTYYVAPSTEDFKIEYVLREKISWPIIQKIILTSIFLRHIQRRNRLIGKREKHIGLKR